MKDTIVLNGIMYQKVGKFPTKVQTKKQVKAKPTLEESFKRNVEFMNKRGYNIKGKVKDAQFTRKDGKSIPVKQVSFSNGKTYNVSAYRMWVI